MTTKATITCPRCGAHYEEDMATNACVTMYPCTCGAMLRPRPGDCCVFCSHADVRCPPEQERARQQP